MGTLDGKVALVTGAGSGIGKATAERLAADGARVAGVDVVEGAADYRCDVSDPASVQEVVDAAVSDFGQLDVVCNIAGIGKFAHTEEASFEDWQRIIGVNLTGTFLVCRAAIPHLLERGGVILNTASNAGLQGVAYSAAYCASKGGVVQLTRALALEYLDRGIRVNAVAPGGVMTPIVNQFGFPEGASKRLMNRMISPLGMSEPEHLASLFSYMATDEARYMTGAIVSMDGGLTI